MKPVAPVIRIVELMNSFIELNIPFPFYAQTY